MFEDRAAMEPHPTAEAHGHEHGVAVAPPDEFDIQLAQKAVQLHCVQHWPGGPRCNNCHHKHPCVSYVWGVELLTKAGWTAERIALLDRRLGAWA